MRESERRTCGHVSIQEGGRQVETETETETETGTCVSWLNLARLCCLIHDFEASLDLGLAAGPSSLLVQLHGVEIFRADGENVCRD